MPDLFQIAIQTDLEKFDKVRRHANCSLSLLKELDKRFANGEALHQQLKSKGLRVKLRTVEAYFSGHRNVSHA